MIFSFKSLHCLCGHFGRSCCSSSQEGCPPEKRRSMCRVDLRRPIQGSDRGSWWGLLSIQGTLDVPQLEQARTNLSSLVDRDHSEHGHGSYWCQTLLRDVLEDKKMVKPLTSLDLATIAEIRPLLDYQVNGASCISATANGHWQTSNSIISPSNFLCQKHPNMHLYTMKIQNHAPGQVRGKEKRLKKLACQTLVRAKKTLRWYTDLTGESLE
ncbi:hypothetical protein C8J56DRAFT_879939 [Mycena floridula]|nr:hypothetical protein C8J56DRAFT_879939 [Mycena floridula]